MVSVIMVSVIMLSVIMLSVIKLSVFMLSVVVLNVVAPILNLFSAGQWEPKIFFPQKNEKMLKLKDFDQKFVNIY